MKEQVMMTKPLARILPSPINHLPKTCASACFVLVLLALVAANHETTDSLVRQQRFIDR